MLWCSRRAGFTKVFIGWLWVSSTKRYYAVLSVFMGLNVGDNMFLGQHLLYDKIINKKTAYNQRSLDTFQRCWVQRQ